MSIANLFGAVSEDEAAQEKKNADFVRGFETASVAALEIERQIKEGFPNQSEEFYRGVIAGLREEL